MGKPSCRRLFYIPGDSLSAVLYRRPLSLQEEKDRKRGKKERVERGDGVFNMPYQRGQEGRGTTSSTENKRIEGKGGGGGTGENF